MKELRIIVERCYGHMHPIETTLMFLSSSGAWYNPNRDIICIWGNRTLKSTIITIDHEFLHRILINLFDLETTKALDNFEEYFIYIDEEDVD